MEVIKNRYNLVDEAWIPVAGEGLVSLMRIFSDTGLRALGGNPVQKIAVMKLLLAIAQAAETPKNEEEWQALGTEGLASRVQRYLREKRDCFWLYGEQPFLQMRAIAAAELASYGALVPSVATGNTTVLSESQVERIADDAEKALLVVQMMGFGLGGKKTDNSVVLTTGYTGKSNEKGRPATGKPGTAVGYLGFLHSFFTAPTLLATLWLNLITQEQMAQQASFRWGLGPIPWEAPPEGEACPIAVKLRDSLMGRLVPYSRFLLCEEKGIRYSEGIAHPGYKEGRVDPTVAVDFSGKDPKVLWVDAERRPWRMVTALLTFIAAGSGKSFDCLSLRMAFSRVRTNLEEVGLWSGGLRVSSNAGEQYVSGTDDYVESEITLSTNFLGKPWFEQLKAEMGALDDLAKMIYGCCLNYRKHLKSDGEKSAGQATSLFWQLVEVHFQTLVDSCVDLARTKALRPVFAACAQKAYDTYCPQDTARQLDSWAAHRPMLGKYVA